jgi:PPOX class probable F420-dependent enzyme
VPICFVVVRERLYSIVDAKPKRRPASLKRLRNIAENPRVAVLVDRWEEDWSRLTWVMLHGRAMVVTDGGARETALAALRAKYSQYRDAVFTPDLNPLIGVDIERVSVWRADAW